MGKTVRLKLYNCGIHGLIARKDCTTCTDFREVAVDSPAGAWYNSSAWACGLTTVPSRKTDLLPRTIESIRKAGFPRPHLFIDGDKDYDWWLSNFPNHPITCRHDNIRTYGNWHLGLQELFIRNGNASYYAMFQDDVVMYENLRQYLEKVGIPNEGYLNLYTAKLTRLKKVRVGKTNRNKVGFFKSIQSGIGALALVFSRKAVCTLLQSPHIGERPIISSNNDKARWWKCVDGGIVDSFKLAKQFEYVHHPSLVEHVGLSSTVRSSSGPQDWGKKEQLFMQSESFRGENFNALDLIEELKEQ